MTEPKYQMFGRLRDEEYTALRADIEKRGVLVAVEKDEDGNTLDGHHREEIAEELGKPFKTVVRRFKTEAEKREHVIKVNLARRHLTPHEWGQAFKMLLEAKGVKRKAGAPCKGDNAETVSALSRELGVDDRTARNRMKAADEYEKLPKRDRKAVDNGKKTLAKATRERNKRQKAKARKKPKKPDASSVEVLLADPPWKYDFAETDNRNVENQYPTATPEEISGHLAEWGPGLAKDCVLFLWATAPKLREALAVMEAWGFAYKTHAVWDKQRMGMGYWFRGQHELLLVGTRGKFSPPESDLRVSSVFRERRDNKHSKKPVCIYKAIEKMFPDATKFEMYQREPRKGWLGGGNESQNA